MPAYRAPTKGLKKPDRNPEALSNVAVVFVYVFVASFQFGVGPIPAFITAELFEVAER